jgi:hypothetical protein
MRDDAFLGKARVNVDLVRKLRSRVKLFGYMHQNKNLLMTKKRKVSQLSATKFLEDLEKVRPNTETTKCLDILKRLKTSRFIVQTNN